MSLHYYTLRKRFFEMYEIRIRVGNTNDRMNWFCVNCRPIGRLIFGWCVGSRRVGVSGGGEEENYRLFTSAEERFWRRKSTASALFLTKDL